MWRVMSNLKLTQGPLTGKRLGDVAPAWQEKWVRTLYGATDLDGNPLYDEAFLYVAKKNGKTSLIGMLAVAHALAFQYLEGRGIWFVAFFFLIALAVVVMQFAGFSAVRRKRRRHRRMRARRAER